MPPTNEPPASASTAAAPDFRSDPAGGGGPAFKAKLSKGLSNPKRTFLKFYSDGLASDLMLSATESEKLNAYVIREIHRRCEAHAGLVEALKELLAGIEAYERIGNTAGIWLTLHSGMKAAREALAAEPAR